MTHQKFPSIEQLRHVVTSINYHFPEEKPVVNFTGTVKIHGTNAGVSCELKDNELQEPYYQSRQMILNQSDTNSGFYPWALARKDYWLEEFRKIADTLNTENAIITIFGEWCGEGIMKGCGINQLSKRLIIFGLKVAFDEKEEWLDSSSISNPSLDIYNIESFQTFSTTVDFNNPQDTEESLSALVDSVENQCPVAKSFGVEGLGEGIVWVGDTITPSGANLRLMFKTKGIKHKIAGSVKKTVTVDAETAESIDEFVCYSVTRNRVDQAIAEILGPNTSDRPMSRFRDILFWVYEDIQKEEMDVLEKSGLTWKQVQAAIPTKVKEFYLAF